MTEREKEKKEKEKKRQKVNKIRRERVWQKEKLRVTEREGERDKEIEK